MATDSRGYDDPSFRGADRRNAVTNPDGSARSLLIAGGILLVVFVLVNLVGGLVTRREGLNVVVLLMLLETTAAALAVVVALLCVVRWRLVGEAGALWAGVALLVFGSITIGLTGLLPLVYTEVDWLGWLRPASRLMVFTLLVAAVALPEVDDRLRLGRMLLLGVAGTAVLFTWLTVLPGAAQHVAGAADAGTAAVVGPYGPMVVTLVWSALAAAFLLRGRNQHRPLLSWLGLMLMGFGLAELTRLVAGEGPSLWSAGGHLLRLTALGVGIAGATFELQRSFSHQNRRLLERAVAAAAAEARERAGRQEAEDRAHNARNALTAIGGALHALEEYRDRLAPKDQAELRSSLVREIARMQQLIGAERFSQDTAQFGVAEALTPLITAARTQGTGILVDIDEELTAYGRWADTAEVVQNLIENARRYAPGSPIAVRARKEGGRVCIRVEDRGPGVPQHQREAIFQRRVRGQQAAGQPGTGLGLYVSARLMRDQGGDLWLEDRVGGGAVFVAALRAEAGDDERGSDPGSGTGSDAGSGTPGGSLALGSPQGGAAPLDEGDQAFEVADHDRLVVDPGNAQRGRLRKLDHHRRRYVLRFIR